MRPVVLSSFSLGIQTYGMSKVLAAWVAALVLAQPHPPGYEQALDLHQTLIVRTA